MIGLMSLTDGLPIVCRNLLQVGVGLALQSTLLLGVGLLAAWQLRRRGPAVSSFVYRATLVSLVLGALLAMPIGRRWAPLWVVALPASQEGGGGTLVPDRGDGRGAQTMSLPRPPLASGRGWTGAPSAPSARRIGDLPPGMGGAAHDLGAALNLYPPVLPTRTTRMGWLYVAIVGVWAGGAGVLLAGLALCHRAIGRLRKASVPAKDDALEILLRLCESQRIRPPLLRVSPHVRSPVLTGLRHPVILLPPSYEREFDLPALRAVLAHELVHMAQGDCAWILVICLACALGWMQPLLWVLARRLEESSEEVCDEEVVLQDTDPRVYARCLVDVAERMLPSRMEQSTGAGMVSCRSEVERRVRNILSRPSWSRASLTAGLRTAVVIGAVAVGTLGLFLVSAPAAPPTAVARGGADAVGGGGGSRHRPTLEQVRELDRRVSYTETKIPLGELVQKVASETGVPLVAAPEVADEPVAVVVKALPARELLEQLADLLDYRWSRRGKRGVWRYEIGQDLAGKQREEALRRAALADTERRLHRDVARAAEMARRPIEEIRKLKEEVDRREQELMKLSPGQMQAFARSSEGQAWLEKQRAVNAVAAPIPQSLAIFVNQLTPQQWSSLRAGEVLVYSSAPQPGELLLPPEIVRQLHAAQFVPGPPGIRVETPPGFGAGDPTWDRMKEDWASANGYRVGVRLNEPAGATGAFLLEANAAPLGGPSDPFQFGPGAGLMLATSSLDTNPQAMENTPERRARWANDPILGRKEAFRPAPLARPAGAGPAFGPQWQVRDLLPEIARVYGVQFISDAYWSTGMRGGAPPASAATPLYQLLEDQAGFAQRWDRKGDLIRLRARTWFFERPREIPLRFVRRWRESYEKEGGLSLAQYLEMVTQLRDSQLQQLPELATVGALPRGAFELFTTYDARHALRLYASLPVAQRQSLMAGQPLRLAEMRPLQREFFLRAVRELERPSPLRPPVPPAARKLTPGDWEDATFALSTRRAPHARGSLGGPPLFGVAPAPAGVGSGPLPATPPGAPTARPPGSSVPPRKGDPTRQVIDRWEFIFRVGPSFQQTVGISAAAAGPSSDAPEPSARGTQP
jgi:beta-lactamase regulating signal transducer with metallopeptidase domain